MQSESIRIFKIDLLNGTTDPLVRSITCDKVIDQKEVKAFKNRLKSFFEKRYNKKITINLGCSDVESIYPKEPIT